MTHSHHHHNEEITYNTQFKVGIILNLAFVLLEFVSGILFNSLALVADAGHNLTDVFGLAIAWGASYLVTKKPDGNFTYGFKKSTILGSQINSVILLVAVGIIIWEAISRIGNPKPIEGEIMIIVAGFGVIINGITTYLFIKGKDHDLNIKGAYLHMLADTIISMGVVISGVIILFTGYVLIDPIVSLIIALLIFLGTYKLLKDATKLSLDAVPESINLGKVKKYLFENSLVESFHDLHVWAISTTETALTVHIVIDNSENSDKILEQVNNDLKNKFQISHTTIQIEQNDCENGC